MEGVPITEHFVNPSMMSWGRTSVTKTMRLLIFSREATSAILLPVPKFTSQHVKKLFSLAQKKRICCPGLILAVSCVGRFIGVSTGIELRDPIILTGHYHYRYNGNESKDVIGENVSQCTENGKLTLKMVNLKTREDHAKERRQK